MKRVPWFWLFCGTGSGLSGKSVNPDDGFTLFRALDKNMVNIVLDLIFGYFGQIITLLKR